MRVAIDGVYFGAGRSAKEFVELAVLAGADGVNWPLQKGWAEPGVPATWDSCSELLNRNGLGVVALAAGSQNSALIGEEEAFRTEIEQAIEAAKVLQCGIIDCWPRMSEGATKEESQQVLASNVRSVTHKLEVAGMVISFEFEPDTTIERYGEALGFVLGLPDVARLTADTYHIQRAGDDLAGAATAMADRIGVLHISGSHRGEPGSPDDECDHEAFVRAAREVGYTGDLVIQFGPTEDLVESLKRAVGLCRGIIERTG